MGCWGRGLLQSDDDYDIADSLVAMFNCNIFHPEEEDKAAIVQKLNSGLLAEKFNKIMSATYQPPTAYHSRERMVIILGILAMRLGAKIDTQHINSHQRSAPEGAVSKLENYRIAMKVLRRNLPTMFQQLQVLTAVDEYKNNGTEWVFESKGLVNTIESAATGKTYHDNGDEFWYSGLGHSADESPFPHTYSKKCVGCGNDEGELVRCSRCWMARYCGRTCQASDWPAHKQVCVPCEPRSVVSQYQNVHLCSQTNLYSMYHLA